MVDGVSGPMCHRQQHNSPLVLSMSKGYAARRVFSCCVKLFFLRVSAPLRLKPCYGWPLSFGNQPVQVYSALIMALTTVVQVFAILSRL